METYLVFGPLRVSFLDYRQSIEHTEVQQSSCPKNAPAREVLQGKLSCWFWT